MVARISLSDGASPPNCVIRPPNQREIENTLEPGLVFHKMPKLSRQHLRQHRSRNRRPTQTTEHVHLKRILTHRRALFAHLDLRSRRIHLERVVGKLARFVMHLQLESLRQQRLHHAVQLLLRRFFDRRFRVHIEPRGIEPAWCAHKALIGNVTGPRDQQPQRSIRGHEPATRQFSNADCARRIARLHRSHLERLRSGRHSGNSQNEPS